MPPREVVTARVVRVKTGDGWVEASGDILLSIGQPHPRLGEGQVVRVVGMLQRPGPATNPGQFDWEQYYRGERVLASVQVSHPSGVEIVENLEAGLESFRAIIASRNFF